MIGLGFNFIGGIKSALSLLHLLTRSGNSICARDGKYLTFRVRG